jgi:outer membrane protein TolC
MKSFVTTALVIITLGAGVGAQSGAPPTPRVQTSPTAGLALTLKDAIARGLATNLEMRLATARVEDAEGGRTRAMSDLLPHLAANVRESQQIISTTAFGFSGFPGIPSRIGPFNVFDARVSLSAPVVDISAREHLASEGAALTAEQHSLENERELVMLAVAKLYLDSLASASRVEAVRAQVATAEALARLADDQKANGIIAGVDALRQQVELQSARQRLIAAENAAAKDRLLLARAIGLPADQAFELSDRMQDVPTPVPSLDAATAAAMTARADLKSAGARVDAAQASRSSAATGRLPTLHFDADYGAIGNTANSAGSTYSAAASLHVPIFQGGETRAKVQQADAELHRREAELADLKVGVTFEISAALLDLQTAGAAVEVAKSTSEFANQELQQAQDRFRAGVANTIELAQAQDAVAAAADAVISSVYAHNLAKAALARAMGVVELRLADILGGR